MKKSPDNTYGLRTKAVHAGELPDPNTGASAPNLVMSTTYLADPEANFSVEGLPADAPFFYTRWGNPTVRQLEEKLCALEGAEAAVAFGSGMAAISALFFALLRSGDHLVISDVTYAATAELTNDLLPGLGIRITKVDMSDLDAVAAAITPDTRLVYAETPCNPILRLTDRYPRCGCVGACSRRTVGGRFDLCHAGGHASASPGGRFCAAFADQISGWAWRCGGWGAARARRAD